MKTFEPGETVWFKLTPLPLTEAGHVKWMQSMYVRRALEGHVVERYNAFFHLRDDEIFSNEEYTIFNLTV